MFQFSGILDNSLSATKCFSKFVWFFLSLMLVNIHLLFFSILMIYHFSLQHSFLIDIYSVYSFPIRIFLIYINSTQFLISIQDHIFVDSKNWVIFIVMNVKTIFGCLKKHVHMTYAFYSRENHSISIYFLGSIHHLEILFNIAITILFENTFTK